MGDYFDDLEKERASAVTKELLELVEHGVLDMTIDYPEPTFFVQRDGIGSLPRGDIVCIKGKAKSTKTFLVSILAASMLGREFLGYRMDASVNKILYFDTEQGIHNTAKVVRRISRICGRNTSQNYQDFIPYNLRPDSKEKRWEVIKAAIEYHKPDVVFIDGIIDVVKDYKDNIEAAQICDELLRMTADTPCTIVCVIHENKAADDSNMRGVIGSELLNKAAEVYEVIKKEDKGNRDQMYFEVKIADCRNKPIGSFWYYINDEELPELYQPSDKPVKKETDFKTYKSHTDEEMLESVLPDESIRTTSDVKRDIMDWYGLGAKQFNNWKRKMITVGHIQSAGFNQLQRVFPGTMFEQEENEDCPF